MRLIGLTGPAGSGKDSVADVLCRDHGFVRYEFARPLKAALNAMFGWTPAQWNDREWKERKIDWLGASPRRLAQTLGTEWGRQIINPDIWLLLAAQFVRNPPKRIVSWSTPLHHSGEAWGEQAANGIVITDCRFQNEAAFISENDGEIWHIDRPGVGAVEAHASEAGLERFPGDLVIVNDGSLVWLADTVRDAMARPELYRVLFDGQVA